jgi:hypothetical protein
MELRMQIISEKLKWITSMGGPLIFIERDAVGDWRGNDAPNNSMSKSSVTDYERACAVDDYIDKIAVGNTEALVLGDLPASTCYTPINAQTFRLVRWISAESELDVIAGLLKVSGESPWVDSGLVIRFQSHDLVLFDSVYPGEEITDSIDIQVEQGTYGISTLSFNPNEELNLFLIELKLLS